MDTGDNVSLIRASYAPFCISNGYARRWGSVVLSEFLMPIDVLPTTAYAFQPHMSHPLTPLQWQCEIAAAVCLARSSNRSTTNDSLGSSADVRCPWLPPPGTILAPRYRFPDSHASRRVKHVAATLLATRVSSPAPHIRWCNAPAMRLWKPTIAARPAAFSIGTNSSSR